MFIHDGGRGAQLTNVRELCTLPPGDDDDCVTSFLDSSASCVSCFNAMPHDVSFLALAGNSTFERCNIGK